MSTTTQVTPLQSRMLADASEIMSKSPMAIQLRYLQTLTEISTENASTIVFPVPLKMLEQFFAKSTSD